MHYKVQKIVTRMEIGRELSRELFAVSINEARTVLGTASTESRG